MRLAGRAITTVRPWWGLAAVVVAFAAIASLYAFEQPPFVAPDESAHVGYAHEIAHLRLPEITMVPDVPSDATQWIAERTSAKDDRYRGVWSRTIRRCTTPSKRRSCGCPTRSGGPTAACSSCAWRTCCSPPSACC